MTVESVEPKTRGTRWLVPALLALILVLALASLAIGPAPIPFATAAKALFSGEGSAGVIVRDIRLPRTLLAVLIGGTLGAMVSIGLVVAVAGRDGSTVVLVLAGLAIGSLAGAATSLAISLSPNPFAITEIVFWLLGSLEDRSMVHVVLAAPFLAIATALLLTTGRALRALSLGEETARSLGVDVTRTRLVIVGASAVGAGASVAVAGAIGFVGLVAPHLVRPLCGYDPARTLVPATLAGAALLLAADCAVRLIPSGAEVRIGVLTALLGVPVFLWIIARRRGELADVAA